MSEEDVIVEEGESQFDPKCYICLSGGSCENCQSCEKIVCSEHSERTFTFFGFNDKDNFHLKLCDKCGNESKNAEKTVLFIYMFTIMIEFIFLVLYTLIFNIAVLLVVFLLSTVIHCAFLFITTKRVIELRYYRRLQLDSSKYMKNELFQSAGTGMEGFKNIKIKKILRTLITLPLIFPLLSSVFLFLLFFLPKTFMLLYPYIPEDQQF